MGHFSSHLGLEELLKMELFFIKIEIMTLTGNYAVHKQ
jgi:hypothetical protein